jgi:hypothetical protein
VVGMSIYIKHTHTHTHTHTHVEMSKSLMRHLKHLEK